MKLNKDLKPEIVQATYTFNGVVHTLQILVCPICGEQVEQVDDRFGPMSSGWVWYRCTREKCWDEISRPRG